MKKVKLDYLEGFAFFDCGELFGQVGGDYLLTSDARIIRNQVFHECEETYYNPKFVKEVPKTYR